MSVTPFLIIIISAITFRVFWGGRTRTRNGRTDIPFIPPFPKGPFSSLRALIGNFRAFNDHLLVGYTQHGKHNRYFQMFTLHGPTVYIPPTSMDEFKKARTSVLSFYDAADEFLQSQYVFDPGETLHEFGSLNIAVIKQKLHSGLAQKFPALLEENTAALDQHLDATVSKEWTKIPVLKVMLKIIGQTTNRVLVGLPYCREASYLEICEKYANDALLLMLLLPWVPAVFRPLVYRLSNVPKRKRYIEQKLAGLLSDRLAEPESQKPAEDDENGDILSCFVATAMARKRTIDERALAIKILGVNFAALHTSSMVATQIIYDLASHPEYIQELREEVHTVLEARAGWSFDALRDLTRLDSFIKESMRLHPVSLALSPRKVKPPEGYTFADGFHLAQGEFVSTPAWAIHHDHDIYGPDASDFRGFRFVENNPTYPGNCGVSTDAGTHFYSFGQGKTICPGRFFAMVELKLLIGKIVMDYDLEHIERPMDICVGNVILPQQKLKLGIRLREGR